MSSGDTRALYDRVRSNTLIKSQGYGWLHILNSVIGSSTSFDDITDSCFSAYRDVYDRLDMKEVDVLRSMFRFIGIFTGSPLPDLNTIPTTNVPDEVLVKLDNVELMFDINRMNTIPELTSKSWKFYYFMWQVNKGRLIRDAEFFTLFDTFKPPIIKGLPTPRLTNIRQLDVSNLTLPSRLESTSPSVSCLLANVNDTSMFSNLNELKTFYNAAVPNVTTLDDSTCSGIYLLRRTFIAANRSIFSVKTEQFLRVVIDPYDTRGVTTDRYGLNLVPYQVITQSLVHFTKPNRNGFIEIITSDITNGKKSNSMTSPASFYHVGYTSSKNPIITMTVQDVIAATIKRNVLVVDFAVNDAYRPSNTSTTNFMITPPITLGEINDEVNTLPFTIPASQWETKRYPPANTNSYIYSSSTNLDASVNAWGPQRAFDYSNTTRWSSAAGTMDRLTGLPLNRQQVTLSSGGSFVGEWIQIQLPVPTVFKSAGIRLFSGLNQYLICGSMNGSTWTTVHLRNIDHNLVANRDHTITFNNNANAYYYYRFVFLRGMPNTGSDSFSVWELWYNEITGSDVAYMRDDIIMASRDPNTRLNISLTNLARM